MKAALLLSGGMDSICIAWWKRPQIAITIDYGQAAAEAEIMAAAAVCEQLGIEHHVLHVDCRSLGSGDMAGRAPDAAAPATDWWPYRNQLLITLAAMEAIAVGAAVLYIGTVKSDGSHKDGTPEFVDMMNRLLQFQEGGLGVEAPGIAYQTTELAKLTEVPADLIAWAHSCHKSNVPCGNCRGCNKYEASMFQLGYACEAGEDAGHSR